MASTSSGSVQSSAAPSTAASTASESSTTEVASIAHEKTPDESSKLKMFLGILRKFIGVADIASVRFSLPAQLLEPTPNLEYWNYLDRPNCFVAIGDSDDELDRMIEVLRFWFTKDLKYVKGKPCKPYNSTLGEFFRCNWDVVETMPPITASKMKAPTASSASSVKSGRFSRSTSSTPVPTDNTITSLTAGQKLDKPIRVAFLTEQTSHHPPVSAFVIDCPDKGLTARGFDQISAKFTGTSIKVGPGEHNLGIFINLAQRDNEQYQLTHPSAHLGGLLRGALSVSVGDQCYISCPKTKIKTILHYIEEGWIGKTQNKVEGVIFRYDPDNDDKTRIRDVPDKDVLARISGNWKDKLYYSLGPKPLDKDNQVLIIDLSPLEVATKNLPPMDKQLQNESLKFWSKVTDAILSRQFSLATSIKVELEERQRAKAKEREETKTTWQPRFFTGVVTPLGKPELTDEGQDVLKKIQLDEWDLAESKVLGA